MTALQPQSALVRDHRAMSSPGGLGAVREHLEEASAARRRGDLAAADAAETLALLAMRAALYVPARQAVAA